MNPPDFKLLPESVETLVDWKLPNDDLPFKDESFLENFDQHAENANKLFRLAFAS